MRVLVKVIDEGGFAKAARALDLAPPVVTRIVAELEDHLGARLLHRTTRRIAPTDVGEAYVERARRILAEVEDADALVSEATKEPRGTVRVLANPAFAVHQLAKQLPRFRARHPQVMLEIAAQGPVEAVDEDYDLTLMAVRQLAEGDYVARPLARSEVVLCAAPEYLERRGRPRHPHDLVDHDALVPPIASLRQGIVLHHDGGETVTIMPSARAVLRSAHMDTNYAAALHGLGIAGLPSMVADDALAEHALERVLPGWHLWSFTIWAAMPTRRHVPAKTRALLDFLVEAFGGADRDPWLAAPPGAEPVRT